MTYSLNKSGDVWISKNHMCSSVISLVLECSGNTKSKVEGSLILHAQQVAKLTEVNVSNASIPPSDSAAE